MDVMEGKGDFKECPHCNGYGSSLKEAADKCSKCSGFGIVKKEATNGNKNKS